MDTMYYTYVLESCKDKKLYTGYTSNLKERFDSHQKGKVDSTRKRRPFKLVYYEACLSQKDAMHRELYLKTRNGRAFLKRRIKSYVTGVESK